MDWLKELIKSLPLEAISEVLARLVFWWIGLTKDIDPNLLAIYVYVGGSMMVLGILYFALKMLPKSLAGVLWFCSAAVLLTPGSTSEASGGVAPAIMGVLHALLMGNTKVALRLFLPIVAVAAILTLLGSLWQFLRHLLFSYQKS